jgi:hypothetical protein
LDIVSELLEVVSLQETLRLHLQQFGFKLFEEIYQGQTIFKLGKIAKT